MVHHHVRHTRKGKTQSNKHNKITAQWYAFLSAISQKIHIHTQVVIFNQNNLDENKKQL